MAVNRRQDRLTRAEPRASAAALSRRRVHAQLRHYEVACMAHVRPRARARLQPREGVRLCADAQRGARLRKTPNKDAGE